VRHPADSKKSLAPRTPTDKPSQIDALTAQAKKYADLGLEMQALALLRKAADLVPGAPWLQHRTAELARKLERHDVATQYYRRAGAAFIEAGFAKHAVLPLHSAWLLAYHELPIGVETFIEVSCDLVDVHEHLGSTAQAAQTIEHADAALLAKECPGVVPRGKNAVRHSSGVNRVGSKPSTPAQRSGNG
jgi:tetratricopeptide (TPR) repeat protein